MFWLLFWFLLLCWFWLLFWFLIWCFVVCSFVWYSYNITLIIFSSRRICPIRNLHRFLACSLFLLTFDIYILILFINCFSSLFSLKVGGSILAVPFVVHGSLKNMGALCVCFHIRQRNSLSRDIPRSSLSRDPPSHDQVTGFNFKPNYQILNSFEFELIHYLVIRF